jgi:hypothetical protein
MEEGCVMPSSARRLDLRTLRAASVTAGGAVVPVPQLTAGTLAWRWELSLAVAQAWRRWTEQPADVVSSAVRLVRPPGGRAVVAIDVALAGHERHVAERLAPLRRLEPDADTVRARATGAVRAATDPVPAGAERLTLHRRLAGLPPAAVDAFVALPGPSSGSPLVSAELHLLGGRYAVCAIGAAAGRDEAERVRIWLAQLERRLAPWLAG